MYSRPSVIYSISKFTSDFTSDLSCIEKFVESILNAIAIHNSMHVIRNHITVYMLYVFRGATHWGPRLQRMTSEHH